jgi:tetratricopeptide (TPR) repeat protein
LIEDMHAADPSSVRLLQFLSHALRDARVLLVATYRDTEFTLPSDLAGFDSIALGGLDATTLRDWSRVRFGVALAPPLVAQLVEATAGNALLADAVFTSIARAGGPESASTVLSRFRLPEPIAQAVRRGLQSLPDATRRVLAIASVIGRDFDVAMLRTVAESQGSNVVDALGPATGSWVREVGLGRFEFSHGMVRDALYTALPPGERAAFHRRVGEALARGETSADTLAHHFLQATPAGDATLAVSYSIQAGNDAHRRLAYEEAVQHFRNALDAHRLGEPDEALRTDVLIGLGNALRCNGDGTLAIETFERAYEAARATNDALRLARAADGYATAQTNIVDPSLIERLGAALAVIGDRDKLLHARLTAHFARASTFGPDVDVPDRTGREAVALARDVGDLGTLAVALAARRWSLRGTTPHAERIAFSTEAVATALAAGDISLACQARAWTIADHLEGGRRTEMRREMRAQAREAAMLREPSLALGVLRSRTLLANLEGRFDEAAQLAEEALAHAQQHGDQNGTVIYWIARAAPLRVAMRFGEMEPFVTAFNSLFRMKSGWACLHPVILIETGRPEEARPLFDELASNDFADIRCDVNYATSLSYLCETAALLGDRTRSEHLYPLMAPFAGTHIVISLGTGYNGPVDRCLGLLAETMGNLDLAIEHYESALQACDEVHAHSYAARTRFHLARARWERNANGDRTRARREIAEATSAARRMAQASLLHALKSLPSGLR